MSNLPVQTQSPIPKVFPLEKFGDFKKDYTVPIVLMAVAMIAFITAVLMESGTLGLETIQATPLPLMLGSVCFVFAIYAFFLK